MPKGRKYMASKHYESVVIINASLEDPQVEEAISSIKTNLKTSGGEITDTEDWGRKRLAYSIDNAKSGYYFITRFSAPTSSIKEFERTLKLDENVIRYMTIALDKKALNYLETAKSKLEEESADKEVAVEENSKSEESKD
jgi:small subunit ribosomal protein S6